MEQLLHIQNLHACIKEKEILKGISLEIPTGHVHALMGPNGSGKSSLALTLMGHPRYTITDGSITLRTTDITGLPVDKRAQAGLFLAFQTPFEIEGISLRELLYQTTKATDVAAFEKKLSEKLSLLSIKPEFVERSLNVGFSGGEKKQAEILQLAMLEPKLAILDEIDSGLDVDALKTVCSCINTLKKNDPELTLLVITHYPRILHYLIPDAVHVMQEGVISKSGDKELAQHIEQEGYEICSQDH